MTEIQHLLDAPGDAPSDAELISRVRGGDLEAYGELYARHVDAARRLARQLVRGPDSDDLVSDAFAKVMGVLRRGGGPDVAFRAYLLTAVRRLHVDRIRAQSRLTTTDDLEPFDPGVPFQDTAVAQFESGAAARAFASLPERWQLVLWHLEVEGQKPAEIAVLLGMSPNSVSALAYRAREGLRQAFLAAHLAETDKAECRWVTEHLGGYVRKGLSKRDHDKVALHLDECPRCTAMYLELTEVNDNLAGIIAPLLLGGLAAGYLADRRRRRRRRRRRPVRPREGRRGRQRRPRRGRYGGSGRRGGDHRGHLRHRRRPAHRSRLHRRRQLGVRRATARAPATRPTPSRIPAPRTSSEVVSAQEVARVAPGPDRRHHRTAARTWDRRHHCPRRLRRRRGRGSGDRQHRRCDGRRPHGRVDRRAHRRNPTDGPTDTPGDPETDIRISSATVSDDALVVDVDGLPEEPVTILVDLASDSGRAAFVPGQRTCSVDAATPTRAVCVTSTAMARAAAFQLAPSSFQAVIPLDFPADMDADFLDVTVNVLGYREIDDTDNSFRFEYRPDRDPTDGPTTDVPDRRTHHRASRPTDPPPTSRPTDRPPRSRPTDPRPRSRRTVPRPEGRIPTRRPRPRGVPGPGLGGRRRLQGPGHDARRQRTGRGAPADRLLTRRPSTSPPASATAPAPPTAW